MIGHYFKTHPGARQRVHLATKGSITRNMETNVRTFNNSPEHLRTALEGSLQRLGVDARALLVDWLDQGWVLCTET